jgi:hypothetical protein
MSDKELKKAIQVVEDLRIKFSHHTDPDLDAECIFDRIYDLELRLKECLKVRKGT